MMVQRYCFFIPLYFTTFILLLKLEVFLKGHESNLPLPPADGENTIFEYVVNSAGEWEHWHNRVSRTNTQT